MSNESQADREKREAAEAAAERAESIRRRKEYIARIMAPRSYGLSGAPLDTPQAVGEALTALRSGGVNIIGPEVHMDYLPRHHIVSLRWAFFDQRDPVPTGPEGKQGNGTWYQQQGGGLSPAFGMLTRLASLCNVTWLYSRLVYDHAQPLYWRYQAGAKLVFFDGAEREEHVDDPYDLRDGSPEVLMVRGKTAQSIADQVGRMRAKGAQRAESFAKSRALRQLLGLDQKYTEEAADMPFVWPTMVNTYSDPQLDRMAAMKAMGLLGSIYGKRDIIDIEPRMLPAPGADPVDYAAENARLANRERVPVGESVAPPVAAPAPQRAPAVTDPDAPPFEAPPAPAKWRDTDYTLAEVADYCEAQNWPDPTKEAEPNLAKLEAWLRGARGSADIRAFLGKK